MEAGINATSIFCEKNDKSGASNIDTTYDTIYIINKGIDYVKMGQADRQNNRTFQGFTV